MVIEWEFI
jgi:hypothetical protein